MNKTKTIYFLSAIVLIIGCYALNLSYSLFVQTESKDIVNATVPVLSYNLEQNTYTIPASSSELIILTVNNTGTTDINYGISTTKPENVSVKLVEKIDNNITGTIKASESQNVAVYATNNNDSDATVTFNLNANYSTVALASDFETTSNIDINDKAKTLGDEIISKAKSNDLSYENKTVYSSSYITIPAEQVSDPNERLLLETEDDYTATTGKNSYYFRGSVIDNYVNFAGMCWRIVRVEGDGSVKLIIEDQNQTCDSKDDSGNLNMDGDWALSSLDGSTKKLSFGYTEHTPESLTASDGSTNAARKLLMDYLHPQTSGDLSMSVVLKNFQNSFTNEQLSRLKIGNWCIANDAYIDNDITKRKLTEQEKFDRKVKKEQIFYDAYLRLKGDYGYNPTLKCNGILLDDFDDTTNGGVNTPMYVGAVTAFEVIYSGLMYADGGSNVYIIPNGEKSNEINTQMTLSLYAFNGTYDSIYRISSSLITSGPVAQYSNGVRPAVSVKYAVATANEDYATYGYPGTQTNPYVIK